MPATSKPLLTLCALAGALVLSACGERPAADAAPSTSQDQAEALPGPEQFDGSITGMSARPGPGNVPLSGEPPPPVVAEPADEVDLLNPETGMLPGAPADTDAQTGMPAEPTPQDAVAVVRDYYAAIGAGSYARAYALWSDGGRASKQTPQQFADGFADTADVVATLGEPSREDPGAGQRYIQVPASITATRTDGSVHRYAGTYTLHRTVVDGATDEQRAWRIASADLREVRE
ncbi:MAG TPA: hypothetical protein VFF71_09645 [Luteimonas sp.]|nr:hypothetical protein [Luteimonas sp.]